MSNKHKVFISYHHEEDQHYKCSFLETYGYSFIDVSVDTSIGE